MSSFQLKRIEKIGEILFLKSSDIFNRLAINYWTNIQRDLESRSIPAHGATFPWGWQGRWEADLSFWKSTVTWETKARVHSLTSVGIWIDHSMVSDLKRLFKNWKKLELNQLVY